MYDVIYVIKIETIVSYNVISWYIKLHIDKEQETHYHIWWLSDQSQ